MTRKPIPYHKMLPRFPNPNRIPSKEIFGIDWTNLDQVMRLAYRMGPDNVVVKHPARPNYNITKRERAVPPYVIIYGGE